MEEKFSQYKRAFDGLANALFDLAKEVEKLQDSQQDNILVSQLERKVVHAISEFQNLRNIFENQGYQISAPSTPAPGAPGGWVKPDTKGQPITDISESDLPPKEYLALSTPRMLCYDLPGGDHVVAIRKGFAKAITENTDVLESIISAHVTRIRSGCDMDVSNGYSIDAITSVLHITKGEALYILSMLIAQYLKVEKELSD